MAFLENAAEVDSHALERLALGLVYAKSPRQDKGYLPRRISSNMFGRQSPRSHLVARGLHASLPVHELEGGRDAERAPSAGERHDRERVSISRTCSGIFSRLPSASCVRAMSAPWLRASRGALKLTTRPTEPLTSSPCTRFYEAAERLVTCYCYRWQNA